MNSTRMVGICKAKKHLKIIIGIVIDAWKISHLWLSPGISFEGMSTFTTKLLRVRRSGYGILKSFQWLIFSDQTGRYFVSESSKKRNLISIISICLLSKTQKCVCVSAWFLTQIKVKAVGVTKYRLSWNEQIEP